MKANILAGFCFAVIMYCLFTIHHDAAARRLDSGDKVEIIIHNPAIYPIRRAPK